MRVEMSNGMRKRRFERESWMSKKKNNKGKDLEYDGKKLRETK
jgi:hypothetical protein